MFTSVSDLEIVAADRRRELLDDAEAFRLGRIALRAARRRRTRTEECRDQTPRPVLRARPG
jgi:hypothetical protein